MSHTDKNKCDILKELEKGYVEMSAINLEEANSCIDADNDALQICEKRLTECE